MSAETPPVTDVSQQESASPPRAVEALSHPAFKKTPWTIAILLAGVVGWLAYTFSPEPWGIPASLSLVGPLSPASEQAELAAVQYANLWKNSLLKFSLTGLGLGLVGIFLCVADNGRRWSAALVTLVSGLICGVLAGTLGLLLRQYLDLDRPLPLISTALRPMVADALVFSLISILLLLPVSVLLLLQPLKSERHKAFAIPLAGILTGLLVPIASAMLMSSYTNTSFFPPRGLDVTTFWFVAMAVFAVLIVAFYGHKPDTATTTAA